MLRIGQFSVLPCEAVANHHCDVVLQCVVGRIGCHCIGPTRLLYSVLLDGIACEIALHRRHSVQPNAEVDDDLRVVELAPEASHQ